jgi:transcription elongation factor GreB
LKSNYITPEGFKKLADELDHLWRVERPRVTQEVSDAAALGDRSENAEYIYGKRRLREIDRRLRFLTKRLDELVVVQPPDGSVDTAAVRFGAWVEVEDEAGEVAKFRIVGADESDAQNGHISVDSPMARALLGKKVDDEVLVRAPKGEMHYTILRVSYSKAG